MHVMERVAGLHGEIELFLRYADGRERVLGRKRNVILNCGMDLAAAALGGQLFVNGMYMAFANDPTLLPIPTPAVTTRAEDYQTTGSTGKLGFVRVPTIALPTFSSTDILYTENKVSFVAISGVTVAVASGDNEVTDTVSQFYGAALAHLDPDDMANDLLFSAVVFTDVAPALVGGVITKIAGANIGIRWGIYFELPAATSSGSSASSGSSMSSEASSSP